MDVSGIQINTQMQIAVTPAALGAAGTSAPAPPPAVDSVELSVNVSYDDSINRMVYTLYDTSSGEALCQVPPEKVRRFVAAMLAVLSAHLDATA
jgi:hypothetical protein